MLESLPSVSLRIAAMVDRVPLLEEAMYCFLKQDYAGKKELVVFNDHPNIKFFYNHPEIRVINSDKCYMSTYRNLHELKWKILAATALCENDIVMPLGDDDMLAPWAMSTAVRCLSDSLYVDIIPCIKIEKLCYGVVHAVCAYRKTLWERNKEYCSDNNWYGVDETWLRCSVKGVDRKQGKGPPYKKVTIKDDEAYYWWRPSGKNYWGKTEGRVPQPKKYREIELQPSLRLPPKQGAWIYKKWGYL